MSYAVSVENVSKKYCRSLKSGMVYSMQDIARDILGIKASPKLRPNEFWSLNDISFDLKQGESLGLIGHNGAGKSTLLKALNGIIRPDKGRIKMSGRIGALIEVGAGFHPMLTGKENVYLNGTILGMTKREIEKKYDDIVDFSGLSGSILDAPVKTYSSGMYVRLGFAVAIHCDPDILLVDEVLSVGDGAFRVRCADWIADYLKRDGTLILVSHYLPTIRETCDKVIFMEHGTPKYVGDTLTGLQHYQNAKNNPLNAASGQSHANADSPLLLTMCEVLDTVKQAPADDFQYGQSFCVKLEISAQKPIDEVHVHLIFPGSDARTVCGWTSRTLHPDGMSFPAGKSQVGIDLGDIKLVPGTYGVTAFLSDKQHLADYHELIGPQFIVNEHPYIDERYGFQMLEGECYVC